MPVLFRVNDEPEPPARVNLTPSGNGGFLLYLNARVRTAADARVGDVVDVEVAFDPEYRGGPAHPMPRRFSVGLRRDAEARRAWEDLSPSRQKEVLRYLAALRSASARDRNVDRALFVLGGGSARFLGREWNREASARAGRGSSPPDPDGGASGAPKEMNPVRSDRVGEPRDDRHGGRRRPVR